MCCFGRQRDALFTRGDKQGIVDLYKKATEKYWATTVRKQAKLWGVQVPSKKQIAGQNAAAAQKANAGNGGNKQAVETGFAKSNKYPKPEEVDNKKTTYDMKMKDQFILKDGRKIQVVS